MDSIQLVIKPRLQWTESMVHTLASFSVESFPVDNVALFFALKFS